MPALTFNGWQYHEDDYYNVGRMLVREQRLPTSADFPDKPEIILQAQQPPLYFAVLMPVLTLFDNRDPVPPPEQPSPVCFGWAEANPTLTQSAPLSDMPYYQPGLQSPIVARLVLRFLNLLMTIVAVVSLYAAARSLMPQYPAGAVFAAAVLAFEPNTIEFTTRISNDALLLMVAAIYFYLVSRILAHTSRQMWAWIGIGIYTLLAALTKLNGWVLFPTTLLLILLEVPWNQWTSLSRRLRRMIFAGMGGLCLATAALLLINLTTTGSAFGRYQELEEVLVAGLRQMNGGNVLTILNAVLRDTSVNSYLSAVNFVGRQRLIEIYAWASFILAVSGFTAGLIIVGRAQRKRAAFMVGLVSATVLLVLARHAAALPLTNVSSTTMVFAPLRYYIPAFPVVALLIGATMMRLRLVQGLGIILIATWTAIPLLTPNYQTREPQVQFLPLVDQRTEALIPQVTFTNGDRLRVLQSAWQITPETNLVHLRLVTALDRPISTTPIVQTEFIAPDGRVSFCQFPLTEIPPFLWQVGQVLETEVNIPNCMSNMRSGTEVLLRWISGEADSTTVPLGNIDVMLPRSSTCPPLLGTFADQLAVIQYTAPLVQRVGELYLPAVHWYMQSATSAVYRTYTLMHQSTGTEIVCESQPRLNTYPFSAWSLGETVYFDECPMPIPTDAPLGLYQVSISLRDVNGIPLPAFDEMMTLLPNSRLPVATITLTG